jgi:hypothetical protein
VPQLSFSQAAWRAHLPIRFVRRRLDKAPPLV